MTTDWTWKKFCLLEMSWSLCTESAQHWGVSFLQQGAHFTILFRGSLTSLIKVTSLPKLIPLNSKTKTGGSIISVSESISIATKLCRGSSGITGADTTIYRTGISQYHCLCLIVLQNCEWTCETETVCRNVRYVWSQPIYGRAILSYGQHDLFCMFKC